MKDVNTLFTVGFYVGAAFMGFLGFFENHMNWMIFGIYLAVMGIFQNSQSKTKSE